MFARTWRFKSSLAHKQKNTTSKSYFFVWSGRRALHPRPSPWQGDVLLLNYSRNPFSRHRAPNQNKFWYGVKFSACPVLNFAFFMPEGRIELPTPRFSVVCSTTKLLRQNFSTGSRALPLSYLGPPSPMLRRVNPKGPSRT